ncbi:MAG: hypothetical protein Q9171_001982 [Xanthocarpia ochracea]
MGRKPNQLVLEYFDRGAKLEDNSNRYVHTCKACRKNFPKGRIESLIAHIEKSCLSIRREDRTRILSLATSSPQPVPIQDSYNANALDYSLSHPLGEHQSIPTVSSGRGLTGLEALAEASRQLEHPSKPGIGQSLHGPLIDPDLDRPYTMLGPSHLGGALAENGDYNVDPTTGTYENYAFPPVATIKPRAATANLPESKKGPRNPTTLSLIAASATDLEARLPPISREHQDQEHTTPFRASVSPQPGIAEGSMAISGSKDGSSLSSDPVQDLDSGSGLPPAPKPLPNRPHIKSRSEHSSSGQTSGFEKIHGRAQKDKLLAQSFDLWSLTQAVVSSPNDWDIYLHSPKIHPNHQRQLAGQAAGSGDATSGSSQFRQTVTAQLQCAAEQGACDMSKQIMIDLEKRLERKERCQGFETFFVGVILLNCVERMSWAMERARHIEEVQDWPLGKSIKSYMDQAAHFAEFLSKLFQMRGILANVRQNPEDGTSDGSPGNTPIVDQWLTTRCLGAKVPYRWEPLQKPHRNRPEPAQNPFHASYKELKNRYSPFPVK